MRILDWWVRDPYYESEVHKEIAREREKRWRRWLIEDLAWRTCTPPEEIEVLLGAPEGEGSEEESEEAEADANSVI